MLWEVPESAERERGRVAESLTEKHLYRKEDWCSFAEGYNTQSHTYRLNSRACLLWQRLGDLKEAGNWVGAGVMVMWLPQEWAWQAVLLVTGLASLSRGSDGEYCVLMPSLSRRCMFSVTVGLMRLRLSSDSFYLVANDTN